MCDLIQLPGVGVFFFFSSKFSPNPHNQPQWAESRNQSPSVYLPQPIVRRKPPTNLPMTAPSSRSRSARRQSSPSLNLDKSLTTLPRASDDPTRTSKEVVAQKVKNVVLRVTRGENGVSKKKSGKELSRQKKKRIEKATGKAEAVMEKLERKRGDSAKRGKVVKERKVF